MKTLIVADGHYYKDENGLIFVESVFNYAFYQRYLHVFKEITVLARIKNIKNLDTSQMQKVSGPGINFIALPNYTGPYEYLANRNKVKKIIKKVIEAHDCAIFRVPGTTAMLASKFFMSTGKPFAIEVVGDPEAIYTKENLGNLFSPLFSKMWTYEMKRICKSANGVSYVTKEFLQKKYPSKYSENVNNDLYFESQYSTLSVPSENFGIPKVYNNMDEIKLVHIANSFNMYGKGHLPLINTLANLRDKGYDVSLTFIGDGPLKEEFKKYCSDKGVEKNVDFTGRLSSFKEISEILRESDIFILPSLAEGLPRSVIEAMSQGLPCLSTDVGGTSEVLDREFLFDFHDEKELEIKIIRFLENPQLMTQVSEKNIEVAKEYTEEKLTKRRVDFYQKLKNLVII
jgi:glycosyltransferase involved in cell wall biosynthesis